MENLNPDVELSIVLGAREIAKTISDCYGVEFTKAHRNINAMIRAAAHGSLHDGDKWITRNVSEQSHWISAAETLALDGPAFDRALGLWWKSLDDKGKLDVIMSSHKETEFLNNIKQKYQSKPDALAQELPALDKIYKEQANPSRVPVPSTAPESTPLPVEEEAPSA